jgi:prepilin-type N-terminal cleavage/methylation domain-containing protein/prepilin-type processing-associated H-X9-DG protein
MQHNPKPGRTGFTLIELLVGMVVLTILAAILLPSFAQVREKARQTQCISNQHQVGQAFMLYAQDFDETLPFFGDQYPGGRVFWPALIEPYSRSKRILECPSWPKSGKYQNAKGQPIAGEYGLAVNYGIIFSYPSSNGVIVRPPTVLARLRQPSALMLFTDSNGRMHIYSPLLWPLTVDWDHDGVLDSNAAVLKSEGPYNRGDPYRHQGGTVCTFADGHTRWIDAHSWLTNRNDLWGAEMLPG